MASFTGSFTAANQASSSLRVKPGELASYVLSGTFSATMIFQQSLDLQSWKTLSTHTGTIDLTFQNGNPTPVYVRFFCTAYTSGTVSWEVSDDSGDPIQESFDEDGVRTFYTDDQGYFRAFGFKDFAGNSISGAAGALLGPAGLVDNTLVRMDGTGGQQTQGTGVVVDDSNNVSSINNLTINALATLGASGFSGTHVLNGNEIQCLASTSGGQFLFTRGTAAGSIALNGGTTAANGSTIFLHGSGHANASIIQFQNNGTVNGFIAANGTWNLGSTGSVRSHVINGLDITFLQNSSSGEFSIYGGQAAGTLALYGNNAGAAGRVVLYGNSHATKANQTEFYNGTLLTGSITGLGAWTLLDQLTVGGDGQTSRITVGGLSTDFGEIVLNGNGELSATATLTLKANNGDGNYVFNNLGIISNQNIYMSSESSADPGAAVFGYLGAQNLGASPSARTGTRFNGAFIREVVRIGEGNSNGHLIVGDIAGGGGTFSAKQAELIDPLRSSDDSTVVQSTANASTTITCTAGSGMVALTRIVGVGDRIALSSAPSTFARVVALTDTVITTDVALGDGSTQNIAVAPRVVWITDLTGAELLTVNDEGKFNIGVSGTTQTHRLNSATVTADTEVLTLTNGPVGTAGNPDLYLRLNINGTNYAIPAWAV